MAWHPYGNKNATGRGGGKGGAGKLKASLRAQLHSNKIQSSAAGGRFKTLGKKPSPAKDKFGGTILGQSNNPNRKIYNNGLVARYSTKKASSFTTANVKIGRAQKKAGNISGGNATIKQAKAFGNRQRTGMRSLSSK